MRASVAIGVLASILSFAASARADPRYRVVLLRPPVTDDVTSDALARVHGELTAAGFDVSVLAQDPALDVRSALETVARELDPIAAFAIVRAAGGNTAEIWVCDRIAGKSVIQSVRLDGAGTPGEPSRSVVLAVQAVELLKASLAQYWLASMRRSQPAREIPAANEPAPAAFVLAGVGVGAGVGWLDSVGAVTAAWQPVVRASYGGAGGWAVRITAGGLGTDAAVQAPAGSASIRQELAALEIVRGFRAGRRIQLVASLGGGAYHARVTGTGTGAQNHTDHVTATWSALALAGGGVVVPIVAHVAFTADAQLGVTWPDNLIRIVGVEAGRTGRPALLASAGVLATF
jgi:hypothetical protein